MKKFNLYLDGSPRPLLCESEEELERDLKQDMLDKLFILKIGESHSFKLNGGHTWEYERVL